MLQNEWVSDLDPVVDGRNILDIPLGMCPGTGKNGIVVSMSEVTVVLASFDTEAGTWNEDHDTDEGGLLGGSIDVLPSVNGQLMPLRRARAVK